MLLQNQYTLLKKANDLSEETLNTEDRMTLKEMVGRLQALTWNRYEMERIRKDLIGMAARCELEGRTLQQEVGGDTDRFLLELAPDLPRGTPLDEVCTWYPRMMLIMVLLNLSVLLVPGAKDPQAVRIISSPFRWLLWLCVWAWFQRIALKIKVRYGNLPQILWYILMLAVFVAICLLPNFISPTYPVTMSYWAAIAYELLWALLCQVWQTVHYNRCAARNPWQEVQSS